MGIWSRIATSLRSGLSGALAPAADPRQTYVSAYRRQRQLLEEVVAATRQVTASKERLRARVDEVSAKLPALLERARGEVRGGHQDLARLTLQRRQVATLELTTLQQQLAGVEKEEANLTAIEQRLATQVEAFAAREEVILARYSAAEAQVRIQEAMTGVSEEFADLADALQRAEQTAESLQARASAIDRLVREGALETPALTAPSEIEIAVDDQLAALQAELAG